MFFYNTTQALINHLQVQLMIISPQIHAFATQILGAYLLLTTPIATKEQKMKDKNEDGKTGRANTENNIQNMCLGFNEVCVSKRNRSSHSKSAL